VFETIIYFLRRRPLFFYSGLIAFASFYSFLLALYFLEWTPFQKDLFTFLLLFSLLWLLLFTLYFKKNQTEYALEREKEKFDLLSYQLSQKYGLDKDNNIFKKIRLISAFMQETFSNKSLLSIKIITLINNSLNLYIENLKINERLSQAAQLNSSPEKKAFYDIEISKNQQQNTILEQKLDDFLKELMSKQNNDNKINAIMNEFENSIDLLSKIHKR
jgi:regulator of replication initiation timing